MYGLARWFDRQGLSIVDFNAIERAIELLIERDRMANGGPWVRRTYGWRWDASEEERAARRGIYDTLAREALVDGVRK